MPLEIARLLRGHCTVSQNAQNAFFGLWRLRGHCLLAQNAISGPIEIAQSLRGHCAVIAQWLKKPYLGI